jgi:DNA-binding winged helix-turn-helix (wHTH) protein/Tol biopolymer transport system component
MVTAVNNRFSFGEFEVDADRRLLLRDGEAVPLKAKTFDLLLALIENRHGILTKNELLDRVWENQFVEENNLTVHVAALRKALGETKNENRYILTVPGKGYRFVAPVNDRSDELVVERRSTSRIVVEEEVEERTEVGSGRQALQVSTLFRSWIGAAAVVIVFAVVSAGWYFAGSGRSQPEARSRSEFASRSFTTGAGGTPDRVAISPDGKTIAIVQRRKGQYALHIGDIESNNSVEIVPAADRLYRYLMFSPDGKNIYFTARDQNHFEPVLMRVSVLGGPIQKVIDDVHSAFTFSPDGRRVAYLRSNVAENKTSLAIADSLTGSNEQLLLDRNGIDSAIAPGLSWSRDGKLIALAGLIDGRHQLMTIDPSTGDVQDVGQPVGNRIVHIAWAGDGSGMFTIRNMEPHPNDGQVWFVSYPNGEATLITEETLSYSFASLSASSDGRLAILQTRSDPQIGIAPGGDLRASETILSGSRVRGEGMNGVCLAPDGKILFTAVANDSRTIWEMNPDGSGQRQLTLTQPNSADEQISVTADNRYLVFQSMRTGELEVWRANRDGTDAVPLTSGGRNSQPSITPEGASIVYVSSNAGKYGLNRIPMEGGKPTPITSESSTWPAVSPDGRTIAHAYGRISRFPNRQMRIIEADNGATIQSFEVPLAGVLYNRMRWSPDGKSIIYKDHTQGLWRQSLAAKPPEEVPAPDDLRVYHFAYGPDGTMVYSGGSQMREIVILEKTAR